MRIKLFTLLLLVNIGFTQTLSNVKQSIENGRIVITYDLTGDAQKSYDITINATKDGKTIIPRAIAGPVNVKPGVNHILWWEPVLEGRELKGWSLRLTASEPLFNMVFVKGGTFEMGSNEVYSNEKPIHTVTLSDFYIGATEVTQAQWEAIMGNNPSHFKGDNLPVEKVSWDDIQTFLIKLNQQTGQTYRLPTEAEWEYAARGGVQSSNVSYQYAGSNTIGDLAWYKDNSGSTTHPVAQKQPNELGLYDMSGNVWEWCNDNYDANYYQNSAKKNPQGPSSVQYRLLRGGSWDFNTQLCRVAARVRDLPYGRSNYIGFRLVRVVSSQ